MRMKSRLTSSSRLRAGRREAYCALQHHEEFLSPWVQAISPSLSIEREVTSTINRLARNWSFVDARIMLSVKPGRPEVRS